MTWQEITGLLPASRSLKRPRNSGITMVLDKGLGLSGTRDFLEVAGPYVDFIKLGFGTAVLYNPALLAKKVELIRSYDIHVYPGGTFVEIALARGHLPACLKCCEAIGFTAIEISDGSFSFDRKVRDYAICLARETGFTVLTEVGKKRLSLCPSPVEMARQANADLKAGAQWVIVEGRESGCQTGIYDAQGQLKEAVYQAFCGAVSNLEAIIWEAPRKSQQVELINRLGPEVNLGNIPPSEVLALEAMRCGLRGDTIAMVAEVAEA